MLRGIAVFALMFGFLGSVVLFPQEDRSTIPEVLIRPQRGEAPRYPMDLVVGVLDQQNVPGEAYRFAREVMAAFVAKSRNAQVLSTANSASLEALFSSLEKIDPRKFRLGSGREEADGAVSFLVRFMGRERGIAGELYIRAGELPTQVPAAVDGAELPAPGPAEGEDPPWKFDALILEDPLSLDEKQEGPSFDLPPYERFF